MPIEWEEVGEGLDPKAFNVTTVPDLLAARKKDPWSDIGRVRQLLPSP
jgi:DNA primase